MQTLNLKSEIQQIDNVQEIVYIEAIGEFCNIYRANGTKELIQENQLNLKSILPGNKFFQIHDLYIINADYIKRLKGNLTKYALLTDQLEIIISPVRYNKFLKFLKNQYVI